MHPKRRWKKLQQDGRERAPGGAGQPFDPCRPAWAQIQLGPSLNVCFPVPFRAQWRMFRSGVHISWFWAPNIANDMSVLIVSMSPSQWCNIIPYLRYFYLMKNCKLLQNIWEHQNSWNSLESKPTTMLWNLFYINLCKSWQLYLELNDRQ